MEIGRCNGKCVPQTSHYYGYLEGMWMTVEEHRKMLDMDFGDAGLEELADISGIQIDRELPLDERKRQYLKKVGNPYLVRVGDMKVKVRFADVGVSFDEAFENMLMMV